MVLLGFGLTVFFCDGGDGAGSGVDADVDGFGEGWTALDVVVADELEVFALG